MRQGQRISLRWSEWSSLTGHRGFKKAIERVANIEPLKRCHRGGTFEGRVATALSPISFASGVAANQGPHTFVTLTAALRKPTSIPVTYSY